MAEEDNEEEISGMDEEDLDDEELEELEQSKARRGRPRKNETISSVQKSPSPRQQHKSQDKSSKEGNPRFGVFIQPPRTGIADSETGEIVGEGDTAVLQILANILERLERIENNLGSMLGED